MIIRTNNYRNQIKSMSASHQFIILHKKHNFTNARKLSVEEPTKMYFYLISLNDFARFIKSY